MGELISVGQAVRVVKKACLKVMSECESHYDAELNDDVYADTHEIGLILKVNKAAMLALKEIPTVDAVPVVRCGECQYWDSFPSCSATPQYHACRRRIMGNVHTMREDFCSQGERKDGEHHES